MSPNSSRLTVAAISILATSLLLSACSTVSPVMAPVEEATSSAPDFSGVEMRQVLSTGDPLDASTNLEVINSLSQSDAEAVEASAISVLNQKIETAYPGMSTEWPDLAPDFLKMNCSQLPADIDFPVAAPSKPIVTCDVDGLTKYILGPAGVEGEGLASIEAEPLENTHEWYISLTTNSVGAAAMRSLSAKIATQPAATLPASLNEHLSLLKVTNPDDLSLLAVTKDAAVVFAPKMNDEIATTTLSIMGRFTAKTAKELADRLTR